MKKLNLGNFSIKYKYAISILPFALLGYLCIALIAFAFYYQNLYITTRKQTDLLLSGKVSAIDAFLDQYSLDSDNLLYAVRQQADLVSLNRSFGGPAGESAVSERSKNLAEKMGTYSSLNDAFTRNVYILTKNGILIAKNETLGSERKNALSLFDEVRRATDENHGMICLSASQTDSGVLLLSRNIYEWRNYDWSNKVGLGTLLVEIRLSHLEELLQQSESDGVFFALLDDAGNGVLNGTPLTQDGIRAVMESGSVRLEGQKYIAREGDLSYCGYRVVAVCNETLATKGANELLWFALALILVSLVFIVISISNVSGRVNAEFQVFTNKLKNTSAINEEALIHIDSNDEFHALAEVYNDMLVRIDDLSRRVHLQEILTREAQIKAYQSQINPHFLYNTLNCISGLAELGRSEDIQKAICALAAIERISVRETPFYTLNEDVSYLRQYIYIQKLRFADKLIVLIDVPEELLDCAIPKLITQPIIENAVTHGVANMAGKGMIAIGAKRCGGNLEITVKDNGPGFDAETLESFQRGGVSAGLSGFETDEGKKSYGLQNIQKRLQLYFGPEYGLELTNLPSRGACVRIVLPACTLSEAMLRINCRIQEKTDEDTDCR
ncbi:MAG: sensor histidine kinase [Eubacteriales bacterium]|nr:sensor histidine kinase [Eubacteriales bacterium]